MATLFLSPDAKLQAVPALFPAQAPDADACPSCGAALAGEFCGTCGERRLREEQFSVRHFVRESWGEVFDLDSRALRSLRLLVTRPGYLTLEGLRGRRRPYLGALKMYLGVFALLTLLTPLITAQDEQREQKADALASQVTRLVHAIAVRGKMTDAVAKDALVNAMIQHESWLAVLIPLLFAAVLYAVFRRRRRWFGEHLLFATHFATFNYLLGLTLLVPQLAVMRAGPVAALVLGLATFVVCGVYMTRAVRCVYDTGPRASIGWALLLLVAFSVAQGVIGVLSLVTAVARILYF